MKTILAVLLLASFGLNLWQNAKVAEYKADIQFGLEMGYEMGYGDGSRGLPVGENEYFHGVTDVIIFGPCHKTGCAGMTDF